MAKQFKSFDEFQAEPQESTSQFKSYEDFESDNRVAEIEQGAYDALKDDFGGFAAGTVDKVSRIISGAADFIGKTVTSAPEAINFWIGSKLFDDEEIDSPEEKKALMLAVQAVSKQASPASYALEAVTDGIQEELDPLINKHEGKDFVDLAQEGSFLEAGDAFLGDVASALPSVGAAFLGPGGLALIGASAFGGKFEEQLQNDPEATEDALLINAASSAGGEILSEVFTAGLGGGLTKLAKKLGPKAAKAILRNTGSKLAFSFTGEGLSEVAAEAWDKLGDYAILGDDEAFEGSMRDFTKTFLIGGAIGGGIATSQLGSKPAVKQAVENYIQPDKIKESQKKSAAKINGLQTQLQEAQLNGDEILAEAISDEIRDERTRLKKSKDKVTEQAENLAPEQVTELKEINDKLSTFKSLLDEGGYDDVGNAVLREQISKLEEQQENIFDNPHLKDIGKKEPYNETIRKKGQAVNAKYEAAKESEGGLTPTKVNEITEDFRGSAVAIANLHYNKIPDNLRQGTFEEFTNAVLYGKRGIQSQIKSHKGTAPLAAFINTFAKKRALELKKDFTATATSKIEDVQAPIYSETSQPTLEVVSNLGIPTDIINDAIHSAEVFDVKVESIQTPKDYIKQQKEFFGSRLTKQVQNLLRPKGVSQAEKQKKFKQFVRAKSPYLKSLYISADGKSKVRRGPTQFWNDQTTDREFVDFITGADLDLTNKTDVKTLTKRKEVLEKNIAEAIGQKAWTDYLDANPAAQKRVNEITRIKENRTLESIKPGITTDYAFQEDTQPSDDDFAGQSQATNKVLEENGQGKLPDSKDPKQYEDMRKWVGETMSQYFPRSFFNSGNFWNAGTSAAKRGFFFETEADFDAHTDGLKFKGKDVYSEAQRYHYKKHSVEKILKDKDTIAARNKANVTAFNEMWKTFDQMVKDNPANAKYIAAFLKSAQNSQNHFSRTGAPIVAYSKTGPYTEEHAMPQSAVSRYLLNTLLTGGDINTALKNTNKNFVQVALNTTDDASLKQNKIGPNGANLNSNMPAGWKPSDNWLARYFNDTSNIDPDSIVFLDSGKTVTETYVIKEHRAPTDNLGKRVGAEFRFTPKQLEPKIDPADAKKYGKKWLWPYAKSRTIDSVLQTSERNSGVQGKENDGLFQDVWSSVNNWYFDDVLKTLKARNYQGDVIAKATEFSTRFTNQNLTDVLKSPNFINKLLDFREQHQKSFNDGTLEFDFNVNDWFLDNKSLEKSIKFHLVADQVADQTPRQINAALAFQYDVATKSSTYSRDETTGIISVLKRSWGKLGVEITTDAAEARQRMIDEGLNPEYVDTVLGRANGFAYGDFIYVDPYVSPETPIHEFGHIWNHIMQDKSPEVFDTLFDKLRNEAPQVFYQQLERIRQYGLETNSPAWKDEIMAGVVGYHGLAKVGKKSTDQSVRQIIKEFYQAIKNLLGFDFKGKNIEDLNVEQMLDLIVDEVSTGKVGKNFKKLNTEGWTNASKSRRGLAYSLKGDPQHDGLQAVRDNYRETKDLQAALEAGYQKVKDSFDKDTWLDFAGKAIREAKVGDRTQLIIAKAKYLQGQKVSLNNSKKAIEAKAKLLEENSADSLRARFRKIIHEGSDRKPSSWFVSPSAEDFQGLLDALLPKGKKKAKQGVENQSWLKETIFDPYIRAKNYIDTDILNTVDAWKSLIENIDINKEVDNGRGYTIGDAIQSRIAQKQGIETDITNQETLDALDGIADQHPDLVEFIENLGIVPEPGKPITRIIFDHANKTARDKHMKTFKETVDIIFTPETFKLIESTKGKNYAEALEATLRRMESGRNKVSHDANANTFLKWVNRAVGTTMFLNTRSAALQLLSTMNYAGKPGMSIPKMMKAWGNRKQFKEDMKTLMNTGYLQDRYKGAKFDLLADELAGSEGSIDKILKHGFSLTKWGDIKAILWGGAPYYRSLVDQGFTHEEAMTKFIEATEESQQSADPSKISELQASNTGKLIFAFANTPFQYTRIVKKRLSNIVSGRSAARGEVLQDLNAIAWYGVGNAALFSGLQTGLFAALAFGDDDDKENEKLGIAIENSLSSFVKTWGTHGAVAGALWEVYQAAEAGKRGGDIAISATSISPPLYSKLKDLQRAIDSGKKAYKNSDWQQGLLATGEAAAFGGVPLDRLIKKADNLATWSNEEAELWQKIMRSLGWGDWEIGGGNVILPEYGKKKSKFDTSKFDKVKSKFEKNATFDKDTPFNKGEVGQAFKDGTIEVDPNQSPEEQAKTVEHEMQHQHDMQSGKLDYDDNSVTWNGSAFKRKGGKIQFQGSWVEEGHPSLPWEAKAFDAESDSPLKRVTGSEVKNARKNAERENIRPGVLEQTKGHEGWREKAYLDQIGIPTIGYGQTTINGKPVELGQTISEEEGEKFISNRLRRDKAYIREYFKQKGYKDINENHLEALSQFTYNAGIGRIDSLTKGGTRSIKEIGDSLLKYDMAGGKKQKFLTTRREEEKQLFDTPWAEKVSAIQEQGVQLPEPEEATAETPFKRGKGGVTPKSKKPARRPSDSRTAARQTRLRQNEANARIAAIQDEEYVQRFINPETGNVDLKAMSEYEHLRGGGTVRNGSLVGNSTVWGLGGPAKGAVKAAGVIGRKLLKGAGLYGKYDDTNLLRERYQTHKDTGSILKRKKFKKRK